MGLDNESAPKTSSDDERRISQTLPIVEAAPVLSSPTGQLQEQERIQHQSGSQRLDRMGRTTAQLRAESEERDLPQIGQAEQNTVGLLATIEHTISSEVMRDPIFMASLHKNYLRLREKMQGTDMSRTTNALYGAVAAAETERDYKRQLMDRDRKFMKEEDSQSIVDNPWREGLERQGVNFFVPDFFKTGGDIPPEVMQETNIDTLTSCALENDRVRTFLGTEIAESIKSRKGVIMISADADNLKTANTKVDKQFGNMLIRKGAADITRALANLNLPEGVKVIVLRQTGAADETLVWITGVPQTTEDDPQFMDNLTARVQQLVTEVSQPTQVKNPDFTFSQTAAMITDKDERLAEWVEKVKAGKPKSELDLYTEIKKITDTQVASEKMAKDMARIPLEELQNATAAIEGNENDEEDGDLEKRAHKVIVKAVGDSRISSQMLLALLEIAGNLKVLMMAQTADNDALFAQLIAKTGLTPEEFSALTSEEARQEYWRREIKKRLGPKPATNVQ